MKLTDAFKATKRCYVPLSVRNVTFPLVFEIGTADMQRDVCHIKVLVTLWYVYEENRAALVQ